MSGLEISKTIFPLSKGHQIAIENNGVNLAYISIGGGAWGLGAGGSVRSPPSKQKWMYLTLPVTLAT